MGTPYANEIAKNAIFCCFVETYTSILQMLLPKNGRLKPSKASMHGPKKTGLYSACVMKYVRGLRI
jgi:hypothetical protein